MLLIGLAYLAGSFPSGLVLSRLTRGGDVRRFGSGNIGAANVARFAGFRVGAAVAGLDILKGVLPLLLAKELGSSHVTLTLVALAAVLGHDFSLFLRFRGGKGVATTFGVMVVLAPVGTLAAAAVWIAVLLRSTIASLASLVALGVLPLAISLTGAYPSYVFLAAALFVLAVGKHWDNIGRLLDGTEPGFSRRRASDA